MENTDFIS